jgi:hypothetical protein
MYMSCLLTSDAKFGKTTNALNVRLLESLNSVVEVHLPRVVDDGVHIL